MIRALIPDDVNALGVMLLVLAGVLLPILIIKSARRLGTGPLPISRSRFYRQTIIFQLFLAAIAAWTAYTHGILAMPLPERPLLSWSAAALMYVLTVLTLKLRWGSRSAAAKQRLYDILPHNRTEMLPYVFICIVAGTAEEFVYRGVMTELAQRLIGIAIVTMIAISISFAAAHAMQGLRSMAGIFVIALACHALVWLAQSLIPVMVVHFAYDLTAGMLIPKWFEAGLSEPPAAG
ncbi:MAG TPA: CPBP family intramembrane glutamic endopeptidase [Thermoanaerobaculia bacterium]|jgi:membrane protease YdiL (CAAX protease family)|nr:CPBP family intramembrane glutamic endopeptidase [Thermoanaerobaculia bacterium]